MNYRGIKWFGLLFLKCFLACHPSPDKSNTQSLASFQNPRRESVAGTESFLSFKLYDPLLVSLFFLLLLLSFFLSFLPITISIWLPQHLSYVDWCVFCVLRPWIPFLTSGFVSLSLFSVFPFLATLQSFLFGHDTYFAFS